jgi:putative ABC transport system permease protein
MFLNYLKLSFRLLARNPFFTGINIVGLAIGFASFYTLWEYATTELKSDQYHKDYDHIARIGANWQWFEENKGTWGHLTFNFSSFFPRVRDEFPEVKSFVRILQQPMFGPAFHSLVKHGTDLVMSVDDASNQSRVFKVEKAVYADSNLFTFFTIPLIYGQPDKVLSNANTVVLSQSTARKYFGEIDPSGKLIRLNDSTTLSVTGVYQGLPHYSHLDFEMVFSKRARCLTPID